MDWPTVSILIVTYDRPVEIRKTIVALSTHLSYPGKLIYHIADDHTPDDAYLPRIKSDFRELVIKYLDIHGVWDSRSDLTRRASLGVVKIYMRSWRHPPRDRILVWFEPNPNGKNIFWEDDGQIITWRPDDKDTLRAIGMLQQALVLDLLGGA